MPTESNTRYIIVWDRDWNVWAIWDDHRCDIVGYTDHKHDALEWANEINFEQGYVEI
jgi:hypothetical protein